MPKGHNRDFRHFMFGELVWSPRESTTAIPYCPRKNEPRSCPDLYIAPVADFRGPPGLKPVIVLADWLQARYLARAIEAVLLAFVSMWLRERLYYDPDLRHTSLVHWRQAPTQSSNRIFELARPRWVKRWQSAKWMFDHDSCCSAVLKMNAPQART